MRANGHYLRFVLGCDQAGLTFSEAQQALFTLKSHYTEEYSYLQEVLRTLRCDTTAVHNEYFWHDDGEALYHRVLSVFAAMQRHEYVALQTEIEFLLRFFFDEFQRRLSDFAEKKQQLTKRHLRSVS